MLKFTMKVSSSNTHTHTYTHQLVADAGYQGEITSASSAAHQPEVFCGLIKTLLTDIITSSPTDIDDCLKEFSVSFF